MKLKVFDKSGNPAGEKDFSIPEFEGDKGLQALKQVILGYLANRRQGTSSVKTRSTVHGTGKKPFRQKGSGTARQGTKVGPQHYHGAVAHGPQPRDWSQRMSRKMRNLALARALFDRAGEGEVLVIEEWELGAAKTKLFASVLDKIAPQGKVLVVDMGWKDPVVLAARNIARVSLGEASDVNAHDFVKFDRIVLSQSGINSLLQRLSATN